jgi:hypothetical protein
MIRTSASHTPVVADALRSEAALTNAQRISLADEIQDDPTSRGYASQPVAVVHAKLHATYPVEVPAARVPREYAPQGDWTLALTRAATRATAPNATPQQKATWAALREAATIAQALPQVRITDPMSAAGIQALGAVGLLTPEEIELLTTTEVPTHTEDTPSRVAVVLGEGIVLTLAEVEEAMS